MVWKTATEINNSHFNIKRSSNALDFESIGSVTALPQINSIKSYSFIDKNSPKGISYYQLEQVNLNGTSENMGTISIENSTSIEKLSIFKNENSEIVTQFTASQNEKFEIDVYEVTGRKIFTYSGMSIDGANTITLNNLKVNTGLYLISLRKSGSIINKKVAL